MSWSKDETFFTFQADNKAKSKLKFHEKPKDDAAASNAEQDYDYGVRIKIGV